MNWQYLHNTFKNKKVLVTGHTGFKGAWLCILLDLLGADVYGYALEPPTSPGLYNIAHIQSLLKKSLLGDIRDYPRLLAFLQSTEPDIIIHMAAQPLVKESYADPVKTYAVNMMGVVHLLEAARHTQGISAVLNVTTDKCYENKEWIWGYRENEPLGGYDPYSSSKACSELITTAYRNSFFHSAASDQHGVALATARAGNVIGGGDWANDRLVPDFIKATTSGQKMPIRNRYAIRPWQHVLEPLTGYLLLCAKLLEDSTAYAEAWNFGPDDADSQNVEWIVRKLCTLWGDPAGYEIDNTNHPHEAHYLKLDCSKAKSRLGWRPRWSIDNALTKVVDWYKAYLAGEDMQAYSIEQIQDYFNTPADIEQSLHPEPVKQNILF